MASLLELLNGASDSRGLLGGFQPQRIPSEQDAATTPSVNDLLSRNPLVLLALGGGIAQGGIGRGLQLALPAMQAQQQERTQQQARNATYAGLRAAGVPLGQALVGALNPEVLKTIARFQFNAEPSSSLGAENEPAKAPTVPPGNIGAESSSQKLALLESAIGHLGRLTTGFNNAGNFPLLRDRAANHVANILRASGMSDQEILTSSEALRQSRSLDELKTAIGRDIELVNSRFGPPSPQPDKIAPALVVNRLSRTSRAILQKIGEAMKPQSSK